jgi:hypothetical protein
MHQRKCWMTLGALCMAIVAVSASVFAPAGFAAKAKPVTMTVKAKQSGTSISGSVTGTLGNGSQTGKAVTETKVKLTWHLKGGTINVTANGHLAGGTKTTGTWTITGGTGKFSGISGGGKQVGDIKTLEFTYTGSVKF